MNSRNTPELAISVSGTVPAVNPNTDAPGLGEIKWFGGLNGQTGRENDYGFIATRSGDLFFHRSQALSAHESLTAGAKVLFKCVLGKKGKAAAESVQVLPDVSDSKLVELMRAIGAAAPDDVLVLALARNTLAPCESEVLQAVSALADVESSQQQLQKFWKKFPPVSPQDRHYSAAPAAVKAEVCGRHYASFKKELSELFSSQGQAATSLKAEDVYRELDSRDEEIALRWAGTNNREPVLAKMLSARAAERAAKKLYEGTGSSVEDISITQLEGRSGDWTTHDLLLDSQIAIDVKNARRPINGKNFYVEHTVPRFKLDRKDAHVRIAGMLSPYLRLEYIRDSGTAPFSLDDVIFLGETSREIINELAAEFGSASFEVVRANERVIPNWVFGYPKAWYRALVENIRHFAEECPWPDDEDWEHVLSDAERFTAVPALCVAGSPLPIALSSRLSKWQVEFYQKLQGLVDGSPDLPRIFLAVLTDFLERLTLRQADYSPEGYRPLLFSQSPRCQVSYPLGAIDPLDIVDGLIATLTALWRSRGETDLARFTNFRFSGLGLLQGRERDQRRWTTLIAYCGGSVYETDGATGEVLLNDDGVPLFEKGRCGHSPLVLGTHQTCARCGKLICKKCSFCCSPCQQDLFRRRAKEIKEKKSLGTAVFATGDQGDESGRWTEVPIEAYEDDLRRGRADPRVSNGVDG